MKFAANPLQFAAAPSGRLVVEVDAPFLPTPEESLKACWAFVSTWKE